MEQVKMAFEPKEKRGAQSYKVPVFNLKLVKEPGFSIQDMPCFRNSQNVIDFLHDRYTGAHAESFIAVYLDNQNRVIGCYLQAGTVNQTAVYPREIFARALLCNAVSLIFAHNHPSGVIKPSTEDIRLNQLLVAAGKTLQIKVLDSLILSDEGHYSFYEAGLL